MKLTKDAWEQLDSNHHPILVAAALIPPPISLDIWAKATSLSSVTILQSAEKFVSKRLMTVYEPLGIGYYYFNDPTMVDTILKWTDSEKTTAIATRLVHLFESEYPQGASRWMALAYLYQTARIEPLDASVLIQAAEHCLRQHLQDDAAVYYQLVIDLTSAPPTQSKAKEAYVDAVLGLSRHKGKTIPLEAQQRLLSTALTHARSMGDTERTALVMAYLGKVYKRLGNYKKAAVIYENAWGKASETGSNKVKKHVALASTDFLFWQGRLSDAIKRYEYVLGNLEKLPEDEPSLLACAQLGWIYGKCGQTGRGIGLINSVLEKANELKLERLTYSSKVLAINTLHDARRNAEAEPIIDELLEIPHEKLDRWILWPLYAAKAYVHCYRGEYEQSFTMQSNAYDNAKGFGNLHHRGPINFDYIDILEREGFIHPHMNYDGEVARVLNWPDIYMQGVGYYYRAKRALRKTGPTGKVRDDLNRSIQLLTQSGAKLDLAYSQLLLGQVLIRISEHEQAEPLLKAAWSVLRYVNEALFPDDMRSIVYGEDHDVFLLNPLIEISETLGRIRNRRKLLKHIITLTLQLTGAERGAFFVKSKEQTIEMIASRNFDPKQFQSKVYHKVMKSIEAVMESGNDIITTQRSKTASDTNSSGHGWQIAYPVKLQGSLLGAFFLERNLDGAAVSDRTLSLLKAISTQVAVALDNVRAYEEIAKLKDQLEAEALFYRNQPSRSNQAKDIIGESEKIKEVMAKIYDVALSDTTVLIIGETGVGKELVAKAIHQLSPRSGGPFIPISITSLNENLISSELFGHEKGAFTNAMRTHLGRFELANKGTLFLDEINSLSLDVQSKLLRVLEEKSFERVGGSTPIKTTFRLIAATNEPLDDAVNKGRFRPDLYYRLNVYPILVPPLRERKEDIPTLISFFVEQYNRKFNKQFKNINKHSLQSLMTYHWPGNVRELKHTVERAVLSCKHKQQLSFESFNGNVSAPSGAAKIMTLKEMERQYIIEALSRCDWKVSGEGGAAKSLDVHPQTLFSKMRRLGIKKSSQGLSSS